MKRKLICVFFMLTGAAALAGTIILTLGIPEYAYSSPALVLVFLSVAVIASAARNVNREPDGSNAPGRKSIFLWVFYILSALAILAGLAFIVHTEGIVNTLIIIIGAITIAASFRYVNDEPYDMEATRCGMVFLRAFRAAGILIILVCLAFIITILSMSYYTSSIEGASLFALAAVGITAAALNLKFCAPVSGHGIGRATRCVPMAAALAITIALCLLSVIFINALMLVIIAAITTASLLRYDNDEHEPEVTRRGIVCLRAFRAASILAILICLAFVVIMFFLMRSYYRLILVLHYIFLLMTLALAGVAAAALSWRLRAPVSGQGKIKAARCLPIAAALVIAASLLFVYLNYIPKYSLDDGVNTLRSEEELAQSDVFYLDLLSDWTTGLVTLGEGEPKAFEGKTYFSLFNAETFGNNPFYTQLYQYYCDSYSFDADGLHIMKGYILFNPATGAYEYMRTEDQDKTYRPGELPWFNYNFMYDRDGQHDAVLNLFFRERWPFVDTKGASLDAVGTFKEFSVNSGEWDAKMTDVMYPYNFPESDAFKLLKSIGEETLKNKIMEQIDWSLSSYKDSTIEVFFYGIDIAIYKNGEVILKP